MRLHNSFLLAIGAVLLAPSVRAQLVALPRIAYVTTEAVRLSDLLPRAASDELRRMSQEVELGRAPQFGSMRVYERAQLSELLDAHPEIARRLALPDQIVVRRSGYPLTLAAIHGAIASFLRAKGNVADLSDSSLQWSSGVTMAEANPALEVRSGRWDPARRQIQFCLRCVKAQACPDFLVYVQGTPGLFDQWPQKVGWSASAVTKSNAVAPEMAKLPILIEAGRRVRLVMQGDGIHISLLVICLQNGRLGETIRVRQAGSPHVFRAEVVSRDLLWSKLES